MASLTPPTWGDLRTVLSPDALPSRYPVGVFGQLGDTYVSYGEHGGEDVIVTARYDPEQMTTFLTTQLGTAYLHHVVTDERLKTSRLSIVQYAESLAHDIRVGVLDKRRKEQALFDSAKAAKESKERRASARATARMVANRG